MRHAFVTAATLTIVSSLFLYLSTTRTTAAELQSATSLAYDRYVEDARRAFLERLRRGSGVAGDRRLTRERSLRDGEVIAHPAREDGIIVVSGGLVHHWAGAIFISDVTLEDVLKISHAYDEYHTVYKPVIASRLLERNGDTYRVQLRIKGGAAGISAVLDVRPQVRFVYPDSTTAYSIATSDEIRELENAGTATERLLPSGQGSGYLWRAATLNRLSERDAGVFVERETIGLSRSFPLMLGWIIEPIARRLGRKSVELSLQEFHRAVRARRSG
jgi:hypothetical protein